MLSMEMAAEDILSAAAHQLAESGVTLGVEEGRKWGRLVEKIPFYLKPKGTGWNAESLWDFMDEEIRKGTRVIFLDHARLITGEYI